MKGYTEIFTKKELDLTLDHITIVSFNEYNELNGATTRFSAGTTWLRDTKIEDNIHLAGCVTPDNLYVRRWAEMDEQFDVIPVIYISNAAQLELHRLQRIDINDTKWVYLENNIAVGYDSIGKAPYSKNKKCNGYGNSDLKKFIENWAAEHKLQFVRSNVFHSDSYELDLLSDTEYEQYQRLIPPVDLEYWLRTPANNLNSIKFVTLHNEVNDSGASCDYILIGLRPVLRSDDLKKYIGLHNIEFLGHVWQLLDNNVAICDDVIKIMPYIKLKPEINSLADTFMNSSNLNYYNSDICETLATWSEAGGDT